MRPAARAFAVDPAVQFYGDFLGCTLDFGGPNAGPGTPYYGQVSKATTTLHLAEAAYDASQGATVFPWIDGIDALREHLSDRRQQVPVWGPAVWTPEVEQAQWDGKVLTISTRSATTSGSASPAIPSCARGCRPGSEPRTMRR